MAKIETAYKLGKRKSVKGRWAWREIERERDSLLVVSDVAGPWWALCPVGRDAQSECRRPATSSPNLGENKPSPWGKRHTGLHRVAAPDTLAWHRNPDEPGSRRVTARHYHSLSSLHVNMCFVIAICAKEDTLGVQIRTHVNSESLSNLFQVNATKKMSGEGCQISSWGKQSPWLVFERGIPLERRDGSDHQKMTTACLPGYEIKQRSTYLKDQLDKIVLGS